MGNDSGHNPLRQAKDIGRRGIKRVRSDAINNHNDYYLY
jgi:hypothetical protein